MVLVFAAEGGIAAVGLQLVVLLGSGKIIPSLHGNQQQFSEFLRRNVPVWERK